MTTAFDKKNQITEGVIWRQLLIFFFPILIGTFFQQLYNTVDTVIVGQFVGKEALASVGGSSAQIVALVVGFFTGLSSGASVTIAQFFGAKDFSEKGSCFIQTGDKWQLLKLYRLNREE